MKLYVFVALVGCCVAASIDAVPEEEGLFGDGGGGGGGGGGGFGAGKDHEDVPKKSFTGSAKLTHGKYKFKNPAWYRMKINDKVGNQPVFQITVTKGKDTTIYYYILHGPYSNTWVYKGYPKKKDGSRSKKARFMYGQLPYRVWWRKHCKQSFTGEVRCQMCFRLDKLTGAMDYGAASSTIGSYTFSKPVHIVGKDGDEKYGMIQFTTKKGKSTKKMAYMMSGPMKGNFVAVSFSGELKAAKVPIHVYKREYCRDHIGHRACRWCFTFVSYTGMKLPSPSYSVTAGKEKVTIHAPQVSMIGLKGQKVPVARFLFNKNSGVHSIYYIMDGKRAGKWFVIARGKAPAPLQAKGGMFGNGANEEDAGGKKTLVYLKVPLIVFGRKTCQGKKCSWQIRTYKTSKVKESKTVTLGGKKYSNLKVSGKPIKGVCDGGCKMLIMEKGGAFSSKVYYYPMSGKNAGHWFAEGFSGFGKTSLFKKYYLFENKKCNEVKGKGLLCRYCFEFSTSAKGFSGSSKGGVNEKGPVKAGGASLKNPVLEKKVKGLRMGGGGGGGGGPGGDGGSGGSNKLALPGKSKSQVMSVTVTYNKKTEKYYHIFSGPRAGLWLKMQTVGKKRKRQAIRPTDLPVLVFHHQNCIQGFSGKTCRYCFRMKSRAGLAWTPIGRADTATVGGKYKLKSPEFIKSQSPKGEKGKKYRAVMFIKSGGVSQQEFVHFLSGPDTGTWYKEGSMGFGKVTMKNAGVYQNHDCKMGVTKRVCRDCFSFGPSSTAISGGGVAPEDGSDDGVSDGPEAAPGYTPKFTFGKDSPRCGVKMCKAKGYTKCLWVYYDKCFEKSSIDKAVMSFENSGKCPFTVYADCKKKTKKGQFYPGDKKAYDAKQPWRKIAFGTCAAKVCAAKSYKSCKDVITHKCIAALGIKQIMGVKNVGMCPLVLHEKCTWGGNRYPLLPNEKKDWGKKSPYTSLRFTGPAAKVCEKTGYKTCHTIDSNRYCLVGESIDNNIAAAYNYAPAQMTFYKKCKFSGTSTSLIPGEKKDWKSPQKYRSIKFTPCVARICKKTKFTSCVTITDSVTCLNEVKMDNLVSSVVNTGSCKLTLYKECTKGSTDVIGPGQARMYGDAKKASWSAVKWTPPKAAPLDFGYWVSHSDDDMVPPGAHYFMDDLNQIPLLNNGKYGIVLPDTTIAEKKVIYHDKLADVVVMRKTWFHDDENHVIKLAADYDYCIALSLTSNTKDQDLHLKKCKKNKTDQWTYDESTRQIKLKANTKRCMKKASSGDKKVKVQLKACSTSGDKLDKWGIKKPSSGAKYQLSNKGLLPWKFNNAYCMAAKTDPKTKDINIIFKKYKGNNKDQWFYNTKHHTINSKKYPAIVMRVSGDIKSGTAIKTHPKKYDSKDQWTFDYENWLIKLKSNTKYCMMKAKDGWTEGTNIVLGECGKGGVKEKWGIEEVFAMKGASVTNVKIMNAKHGMWPMKFGKYSHTPIRVKYTKGSSTYYLYYNYGAPSGTTSAKCKATEKCGHIGHWYYIHGSPKDKTKGSDGKAIAVAKREWVTFPMKVVLTKSKAGKYTVRLDCSKCTK